MAKLKFAMVCASNVNRSMEAHAMLQQHKMEVDSFGVGQHVKLPGAAANQPNVYNFGKPYREIFEDLQEKDAQLYTRNGILQMIQRDMKVKHAPQKWHDCSKVFDVVVCFEERVMEQVIDNMQSRAETLVQPVLIVNIQVKDNHQEASIAAPQALSLCQMLQECEAWEDSIDEIVTKFESTTGRRPLYSIQYY